MRSLLAVALFSCLAVAVATPIPWTNCGQPSDKIQIGTIDATPYPPVKGQSVTIDAQAAVLENVVTGQYTVSISFLGIPIISKSGDFCTLSPKFPCPFAAGNYSFNQTLNLPSIVPAGTYTIQLSAYGNNTNDELICAKLDLQINPSASDDEEEDDSISELPVSRNNEPAINADIIDYVNTKANTTWTAGFNKRFNKATLGHVRGLCGVIPGKKLPEKKIRVADDLPASFDSRQQWGSICPSTSDVRDQGACGSCWAFGAVEAMTDRICIASKGQYQPYLAAEDLTSCCALCGDGCNGGDPGSAWDYFQAHGIVTGGDWNSDQGCYPYGVQACDHHVVGKLQPCGDIVPTPACNKTCQNNATWISDKHFGASSYAVPSDQNSIMTEIMTNGPVEAAFDVYEDFVSYKSGVYQHVTGDYLGGHAIKILGWGTENNTPYWTVANSWNEDWGAAGYFLIARGTDECGIEDGIVAGLPKL